MKKILTMLILILSAFTLASCKEADLKILIWGEYMDDSIVPAFQKEFGVKVKLVPFESNESAITKMKTEKFDLIVPSDYAAEQMIEEDLIQPIDWTKIPNLNRETSFADELKNIFDTVKNDPEDSVDLLNYMVPYFWGNVGILYNKEKISLEELEEKQWDIFKKTDIKTVMYDSSRDGFMIALMQLGYSPNTTNVDELKQAETYLASIAKQSNVVFLTDEILDDMKVPRYDMSLTYSGDAIYIMSEQPKLDFYVPTVGANIWADGFVIPKNARNAELAHQFINFISSFDNARKNTEFVMYQTPRKDVYEFMISAESELYEYRHVYQVKMNPNDEIYRYDKGAKSFMDDAWARIRTS